MTEIGNVTVRVDAVITDKQYHEAMSAVSTANERMAELQSENAELRELVCILAYCMSEDCDCDKCVLNDADMPTPRISACDALPNRIRELGIEVEK